MSQQFRELIDREPGNPLLHYGLSLIHRSLCHDSLALFHVKQTVATDPPDLLVYQLLAQTARLRNELVHTAEWLEDLTSADSTSRHRRLGLSCVYAELHEWQKADSLAGSVIADSFIGSDIFLLRAAIARATGRYAEALVFAEQAENIASLGQNRELVVRCLDAKSMAKRLAGNLTGSIQDAKTALAIAKEETLPHLEPPILADLGFLYLTLGNPNTAKPYLDRAILGARAQGDRSTEAWAVKFQGDILYSRGDCEKARQLHTEALHLMITIDDPSGRPAALMALGNDLSCLGDMHGAMSTYEDALNWQRSLQNKSGEAAILANMAYTHMDLGDYGNALIAFHDAIVRSNQVGDLYSVAEWSLGRGSMLAAMGDTARARSAFETALNTAFQIGAKSLQARASTSMGALLFKSGGIDIAKRYITDALAIFGEMEDQTMIAVSRQNMAVVLLAGDEHENARVYAEMARDEAREAGNRLLECYTLISLGEISLHCGEMNGARNRFTQSLEIAEKIDSPELLSAIYYGLARCEVAEGSLRNSVSFYDQALIQVEQTRRSMVLEQWSYGFLSKRMKLYADYIHLLSRLHVSNPTGPWHIKAFGVAERFKARAFRDLLNKSMSGRTLHADNQHNRNRRRIIGNLSRITRILWETEHSPEEKIRLRREFSDLEDSLSRLEFNTQHVVGDSIPESGIQAATSVQDALQKASISILLEYFLEDTESYLWIVTPKHISMRMLPARQVIQKAVKVCLEEISRPPAVDSTPCDACSALAAMVLHDIDFPDTGETRVIIVPDDHLFYIPFETLPMSSEGSMMLDHARVTYLPSASTVALLRRNSSREFDGTVIAIGISDHYTNDRGLDLEHLPYAEDEAAMVCQTVSPLPCILLTGRSASEETLRKEIGKPCRMLHIATHTLIDPDEPRRSCIVLSNDPSSSEDGILTLDEIALLPNVPALVTLSSCESGMGELISGEGMVALSRAFFFAGAQAVIVSLWPVDDYAAQELMTGFYRHMRRGTPPDEAMRDAKQSFLNERYGALAHPYYWGPYIVLGGIWDEPVGTFSGETHE